MTGRSSSSAPFGKSGLNVRTHTAAQHPHAIIDSLVPDASGSSFEYRGEPLLW